MNEQEKMKSFKVLIIGAGVTGTYVANLLTKTYGEKINLELWDKGRGIGGRMATSRMTRASKLTCDLGAQYFSITKDYWIKHKSIYEEMIEKDILRHLTTNIEGMRSDDVGTRHFVAPKGSASIPKYFLSQTDCDVLTSTLLHTVTSTSALGNNITACGSRDKEEHRAVVDTLVITMPVPQILNLKGDICSMLEPYQQKLLNVQYSSRYVLGLFYKNLTKLDGISWSAKYIYGDPCIRYVAMDTVKRGVDSNFDGLSVVIHTSVPFSLKHLDKTFEEVEPLVLEHLNKVLPNLPEVEHKKFMLWRYSQTHQPYEGMPGSLVVSSQPLMILAGDAFIHSNLSGCLQSAESVVESIKNHFPP